MVLYVDRTKVLAATSVCLLISFGATAAIFLVPHPERGVVSFLPELVVDGCEAVIALLAILLAVGFMLMAFPSQLEVPLVEVTDDLIVVRVLFNRSRAMAGEQVEDVRRTLPGQRHAVIPLLCVVVSNDGWAAVPPVLEISTTEAVGALATELGML